MLAHEIGMKDGKFWCYTEDVISEECGDDNRCSSECVCNKKRFRFVVEITGVGTNEDTAWEDAIEAFKAGYQDFYYSSVELNYDQTGINN